MYLIIVFINSMSTKEIHIHVYCVCTDVCY
nr:MAG TPA: hypothetical protein [Caudoviricetes sp.]